MILQTGRYILAILPVLFTLILFSLFFQRLGWREAFLLSSAFWGTAVVLVTEGLSIFNQLTYAGLTISWLAFDIIAGSILLNKAIKSGFKPIKPQFPQLQRFEYIIIAGVLIIILTTGLIALVSP